MKKGQKSDKSIALIEAKALDLVLRTELPMIMF